MNETRRMTEDGHRHVISTRAVMGAVHLKACANSLKALCELRGLYFPALQTWQDGGDEITYSVTASRDGKNFCGRGQTIWDAAEDLFKDADVRPYHADEDDNA